VPPQLRHPRRPIAIIKSWPTSRTSTRQQHCPGPRLMKKKPGLACSVKARLNRLSSATLASSCARKAQEATVIRSSRPG